MIPLMGHRSGAARDESRQVCAWCGKDLLMLTSGHCAHCLRPLAGHASQAGPGKILRVHEFERARGTIRRSKARRGLGIVGAVAIGVFVAGALVALFGMGMRWLAALFARGMPGQG